MVLGLLGSYDSDDEPGDNEPTFEVAQSTAKVFPAPLQQVAVRDSRDSAEKLAGVAQAAVVSLASKVGVQSVDLGTECKHGVHCECEECNGLMARFVAKNLQTKGIRFKCKLCSEMVVKKADAADHFQRAHANDLQTFKRQKQPKLFEPQKKQAPAAKKISFARDDVLGRKRNIDDADADSSFGGWAKKAKPEPPPCEQPGYQEMMQQEVFTAPPWAGQPVPLLEDKDATDTERQVDQHVTQAQVRRFTSRNVLEVKRDVVRCKLCYKTHQSASACEKHIIDAHREEFDKEQQIWHRFLYTMAKRQPPFGWVCKICNIFFPTDSSTFRHLGKEIFIRREDRHADLWREKEDRWGHEQDQECCGDGLNVAKGLSYESIKMFQEQAVQLQEQELRASARESVPNAEDDSASESEEGAAVSADDGGMKFIKEF